MDFKYIKVKFKCIKVIKSIDDFYAFKFDFDIFKGHRLIF